MEKISISLDRELDLMTQYSLSAEEWWIIQLLFLAQYPEGRIDPLERYSKIIGGFRYDIIESLQSKGVLKKINIKKGDHFEIDDLQFNYVKGEDKKTYPLDIPFTANFIKSYLKHSGELGKELFLEYPTFIYINGSPVNARSITTNGHFGSMEDFFFFYGKTIKWNPTLHREIIDLLQWGKENDMIKMGISTFVINQSWIALKEARDKGMGSVDINTLI